MTDTQTLLMRSVHMCVCVLVGEGGSLTSKVIKVTYDTHLAIKP